LLIALNSLAAKQSKGKENTAKAILQVLNYCATHPYATLCYHASGMVLHIDSDASYLSMQQKPNGWLYVAVKQEDRKRLSPDALIKLKKATTEGMTDS
jgi:hypothetical protein